MALQSTTPSPEPRHQGVAPRAEVSVGFLSAYFSMYEAQMEPDFKSSRLHAAQRAQEALPAHFSVTNLGILQSSFDGESAATQMRAIDPDCVVYSPSMVAPGEWAMRALEKCDAPVVVWNAIQIAELPSQLSHAQSTVNTSTVGCLMLANLLSRRERPFCVVTASPQDPAQMSVLVRTIRAAAATRRLRKARFLRIGGVIPGYDDVEASDDELKRLGVAAVLTIGPVELNDYVHSSRSVSPDEMDPFVAQWSKEFAAHGPSLELADALCRLVRDRNAAGGTVNCHGPYFRDNDVIGIPACLAVSVLTAQNIPFSCTGDLPAAMALFLAKFLPGRAQYCEFYTPDLTNGHVLLAAGGEGDPAWAADGTLQVRANELYPGVRGPGDGVQFALEPGRATLLSMSPRGGGWRLAWATGVIDAKSHADLGGPNGYFRFDRTPVEQATSEWLQAGTTHHHALARGDLDIEIPILATFLTLDTVRV